MHTRCAYNRTMLRMPCFIVALLVATLSGANAADWVRPGLTTNQPIWGLRRGLHWAIAPGTFHSGGEPRGLIHIGYPTLSNNTCELVNFIAIEPIVNGHRGFSELEHSALDNTQGKRLWAIAPTNAAKPTLVPGELVRHPYGVEQLNVSLGVEPFDNGARVRLLLSQFSDAPDELRLTVHAEPGSAPIEYCILTATMGNKARTRLLWLKDEVVSSLKLYPNHKADDFTPHSIYPLPRLTRTAQDDILVAITTDEENPATVFPFPGKRAWHYGGFKVTQYWKALRGTYGDDLEAIVNARYTYWMSQRPIPGGIAFENFEFRERFKQDQQFVFGITPRTPAQLGIKSTVK